MNSLAAAPSPATRGRFVPPSVRRAGLFLLLVALPLALPAERTESIAVSATAAPKYVRPLGADGKGLPETYIVSQGRYFGGGTADVSLGKMTFMDVVKALAPGLAKQNYFPTKDVPSANLAIIVHWGASQSYEDPRGKQQVTEAVNQELATLTAAVADKGFGNTAALNQALNESGGTQDGQDATIARNAVLMGYQRSLAKERRQTMPGTEEYTMMTELNEERYFVVLMAYDYQYMKTEHKPRLLWVTRLSVRSPGNNFVEALPTLSRVGADVFGHNLDGLTRVKAHPGAGSVKLGELEFLGTVENPSAEKPKK